MNFSFLHPFKLVLAHGPAQAATHEPLHQPIYDTSEGSEFLDDALRMEDLDLPWVHTEESIAAGSPQYLL